MLLTPSSVVVYVASTFPLKGGNNCRVFFYSFLFIVRFIHILLKLLFNWNVLCSGHWFYALIIKKKKIRKKLAIGSQYKEKKTFEYKFVRFNKTFLLFLLHAETFSPILCRICICVNIKRFSFYLLFSSVLSMNTNSHFSLRFVHEYENCKLVYKWCMHKLFYNFYFH